MGQEIDLEYIYSVHEATRGTAVTPPTRNLAIPMVITPKNQYNKPNDARGNLVKNFRANIVHEWSEFKGSGDVDLNTLHHYLAGVVKGGVSPTSPEAGVQSWVFTPNILADDLKSFTFYWGEPSVQVWRTDYNMIEQIEIEADGSGTDGVKFSVEGMGRKASAVSAPTAIAAGTPLSLPPSRMDAFIDTASAIGTTSVTTRILKAKHTLPTGVSFKKGPVGAAGASGNTWRRTGRAKRSTMHEIELEVLDTTDINAFLSGTLIKLRCQYNTEALIGATQRGFVRVDAYGYLEDLEWGELEGTNRTVKFKLESLYDATLGADFSVTVQNTTTTV